MKYRYCLPEYGDLSPVIDQKSRDAHLAYLKRCMSELNISLDAYDRLKETELEELVRIAPHLPRFISEDVMFFSSAVLAHLRYFSPLSGSDGTVHLPTGELARQLALSFGSIDSFFYLFRTKAAEMRYNGFLYLVKEPRCSVRREGRLSIVPCVGYSQPQYGKVLVALDLWEHAYFYSYGTNKALYADMYLKQLRWEDIGELLSER